VEGRGEFSNRKGKPGAFRTGEENREPHHVRLQGESKAKASKHSSQKSEGERGEELQITVKIRELGGERTNRTLSSFVKRRGESSRKDGIWRGVAGQKQRRRNSSRREGEAVPRYEKRQMENLVRDFEGKMVADYRGEGELAIKRVVTGQGRQRKTMPLP